MLTYHEMRKCNESGFCIHYHRGVCLLTGLVAEYKCPHYVSIIECELSDGIADANGKKDDKEKKIE